MATSAVPAAIDALVSIWTEALADDSAVVLDGPPTGDQSKSDYVSVGWQAESDDRAAESIQSFASAGARTRDEDFSIACWIDTWTGDRSVRARRVRAYELLAVLENALRATNLAPEAPTLNGAVLWSELTNSALRQVSTDQGVRAGLAFSITCRARI